MDGAGILQTLGRRWHAALAGGAVGGALAGGSGYTLLRSIDGVALWLLAGAASGTVATALLLTYLRSFSVSSVTLQVPPVSQVTLSVNHDARDTAWRIVIELATRVATQPLTDQQGSLRKALDSLYALFARVRDLLAEDRPTVSRGRTVHHIGMVLLNQHLRRFLTQWDPQLEAFEATGRPEPDWEHAPTFRAELKTLQQHLTALAITFAEIADVDDPHALLGLDYSLPAPPRHHSGDPDQQEHALTSTPTGG